MSDQCIVGIGGSAGSLAALKELFDHVPHDNLAYVIVQHLPVHFKSQLQAILQRHSNLDIIEVSNGQCISNDKIHLSPAGMYMKLVEDRFYLTPRTDILNRGIDFFFSSLASNSRQKAIGVVLSGTGMDGAIGLGRIKSAGGYTLVQTPATSQYSSMPLNAIKTGHVDKVLPVGDMAEAIEQHKEEVMKAC
jgi:two-component system CheB/CheR fusion protein